MPTIYEVHASYHRTVAPRDYEKVYGTIEYKATVAEGENASAVTGDLIHQARQHVDATVFDAAKKRQAEVAAAVAAGHVPAAEDWKPTNLEAPAPASGKGKARAKDAAPKEDPAAVAETPAEPVQEQSAPDPAAVAPEGSSWEKAQEAVAAEAPTPDPEITDADLQTKAAEYAKAKGPDKVKGVMKKHKVMRLGELDTQEKRKSFLTDLEEL